MGDPEDLGMLTFSLEEMKDIMADFVAPDAPLSEIMTEELADYIIEKIHFVSWRNGRIKKLVLPPALQKRLAPNVFQYTSDLMRVKLDGQEAYVSKIEAKHVLEIKGKATMGEIA